MGRTVEMIVVITKKSRIFNLGLRYRPAKLVVGLAQS